MGSDKDFEAENDLRSLIEAEKIKRDKKRFSAAMKKRKEMKANLEKIKE